MSLSLLLSSPLSFAGNVVSRKILPTPEAFSWLKLFKGMGYEMGFFVDPSGHVLLPLWNDVVWIVRITVGLGMWIDIAALMRGPRLLCTMPPIGDALVALPEV